MVSVNGLIPFDQAEDLNIPLFLRSIWWYFRLKSYGANLCVEVRPRPRKADLELDRQLEFVLDIIS